MDPVTGRRCLRAGGRGPEMTEDCMVKPDSLIFQWTLWDNVDSYAISWNRALEAKDTVGGLSRAPGLMTGGA